jgi:hypothetical protein
MTMLRSDPYLAFVRLERCCAPGCSAQADHAHHFGRRHGGGGIGVKPHDSFVVPLCARCHRMVHQDGMVGLNDALETEAFFYRIALQLVTRFWLEKSQSRRPGRALEVF